MWFPELCLLTHHYSWPLPWPAGLTLPHLFNRKGDWFQNKTLGNVVRKLAEAKSPLAQAWDGSTSIPIGTARLSLAGLKTLAKEIVYLEFGFADRVGVIRLVVQLSAFAVDQLGGSKFRGTFALSLQKLLNVSPSLYLQSSQFAFNEEGSSACEWALEQYLWGKVFFLV